MGKVILLLLILLFFFSPCYGATVYQWVDNNGTYNFTDDHEKIPPAYRNQVRAKKMEDFPEMAPPALDSQGALKEEARKISLVWERNGGEIRSVRGTGN
jgi:hypothetical protein